jgi:hypothetical protein
MNESFMLNLKGAIDPETASRPNVNRDASAASVKAPWSKFVSPPFWQTRREKKLHDSSCLEVGRAAAEQGELMLHHV